MLNFNDYAHKLDKQIAEVTKTERKEAIAQIKAIMAAFDITEIKLEKAVKKVAAKFKDPVSGKEWSGRGRTPVVFRDAKANGTLESMGI